MYDVHTCVFELNSKAQKVGSSKRKINFIRILFLQKLSINSIKWKMVKGLRPNVVFLLYN